MQRARRPRCSAREADLAESAAPARGWPTTWPGRSVALARPARGRRRAGCRIAEAALAQAAGRPRLRRGPARRTRVIRAPFSGVVVKKMAEVGESVAPIPPGVNISTSSGAIVALADLDTLEVEADVAEANVAQARRRPAGRGHGRGVPGPALQGGAAPGDPDRRPHQGHGAGEGHDPRQGQGPEAGDERQGHVPGAASRRRPRRGAPAAPVVQVPAEAVVTRDGKPVVFEVREGKVQARAVVAGHRAPGPGDRCSEGLAGGETLVAQPARRR